MERGERATRASSNEMKVLQTMASCLTDNKMSYQLGDMWMQTMQGI